MASHLRLNFALASVGFAWLGCSSGGCTMDNPAFGRAEVADGDTGDGDATSLEGGESSDSATSMSSNDGDGDPSTSNGDGDGDPSTTNGDGDADSSTTDNDCQLGSSCALCHVCDESGECVPDEGSPCAGDQTFCSQFLYGSEGGVCYRLADMVLGSVCDGEGQCKPPDANACPHVKGEPHFQCDPGCVTSADACAPFVPAANVQLPQMCAIQGFGPDCKPKCFNEPLSSSISTYTCDFGECVSMGITMLCNPYACDDEGTFCYEECMSEEQCSGAHVCVQSVCL